MRRLALYVVLILSISAFLRLYPTILTGLPFSTDSWSLVRNVERIIEFTPAPLSGEAFDDYNIYWPASQVFGAIASEILSIAPMDCMRILIPLVASLSPLMVYLIVKRLLDNDLLSFIAGLLFAAGGPHAIFTAGVTKESFTNVLLFTSFYFFLFLRGLEGFLGFSSISLAVIMSHHLTYIVLIMVLVNVFLIEIFLPKLNEWGSHDRLIKLAFLIIAGLIYYAIYALGGLRIALSFSDWLSAFSFQVILFMAMFYVLVRSPSRPLLAVFCVLAAFGGLIINQVRPFIPGAPRLSALVFFYVSALIFLGLLAVIGIYGVKKSNADKRMYPILFWLSSTLGLEAYAIFGADPSISLALAYRLPNFIIPAVGIMAAASILACGRSRFFRFLYIVCIAFSASAMLMQSYSAVVLQENHLGHQWLYLPQDYQQALWIKKYGENVIVYGDLKIAYLFSDYFGLRVDSAKGYAILAESEESAPDGLLVTYRAMEKNGYVLGHYGVELPQGWEEKLTMKKDIFYSSLGNVIYPP